MYCINFIDLKGLSSVGRNWDSRLLSGTITVRKIFISCFGKPTRQKSPAKQNNTTVNSPESFLSEELFRVSVSTCRLTLASHKGKRANQQGKYLCLFEPTPSRQLYTMRMQSARALHRCAEPAPRPERGHGSLQLSRAGAAQRRAGACSVQKVLLIQ